MRLTTRRVDEFELIERNLLQRAASAPLWLIGGSARLEEWQAAYVLQRMGFIAPTQAGKELLPQAADGLTKYGWRITNEGRAALAEDARRNCGRIAA